MRTRCILLTALLSAGLLTAQDENSLANLKTAYEAKRTELTAARTATVDKALAAYKAELGTLLANVKQQGNLDYVLAIEAERKRLAEGGGAPLEPAGKGFAHLRRIQWAARQAEDKADAELAEQAGKLRQQYVAALEKLEKDLVAANRIEEAKAVRAEREGVTLPLLVVADGCQVMCVEWKEGEPVYSDMRRVWGSVPPRFRGWKVASRARTDTGKLVVDPGPGEVVHALVPEIVLDRFGAWERIATVKAVYGTDYSFNWFVMRHRSMGKQELPADLQEAVLPLTAH